jgi:hypothetical protein
MKTSARLAAFTLAVVLTDTSFSIARDISETVWDTFEETTACASYSMDFPASLLVSKDIQAQSSDSPTYRSFDGSVEMYIDHQSCHIELCNTSHKEMFDRLRCSSTRNAVKCMSDNSGILYTFYPRRSSKEQSSSEFCITGLRIALEPTDVFAIWN